MNTCEEHSNTVVVYATQFCPFCDVESERDDANEKVQNVESKIDKLEGRIDDLEHEVSRLDSELRSERLHDYGD